MIPLLVILVSGSAIASIYHVCAWYSFLPKWANCNSNPDCLIIRLYMTPRMYDIPRSPH